MTQDRDRCYLFATREEWDANRIEATPGMIEVIEVGAPPRVTGFTDDGDPVVEQRTGWRVDILLNVGATADMLDALDPWRMQPGSRLHRWLGS